MWIFKTERFCRPRFLDIPLCQCLWVAREAPTPVVWEAVADGGGTITQKDPGSRPRCRLAECTVPSLLSPGSYNPKTREFRYLLTNLPRTRYAAEQIALAYKLRWQIGEFKENKRHKSCNP